MRRPLFFLLILLTAFRGIVGDAMAYGMTQGLLTQGMATQDSTGQLKAMNLIAPSVDYMPATAPLSPKNSLSMPCHDASVDLAPNDNFATSDQNCGTCQVCHMPLIKTLSACVQAMISVSAVAHQPKLAWVSADLAQQQKPPVF